MHVVLLPGRVKSVPLSEDFTNKNAYLKILLTICMQCILLADANLNQNAVLIKWQFY